MNTITTKERLQLALLASAYGDAQGESIEFMSFDEIIENWNGLKAFPKYVTDDTQMTIFLMKTFIDGKSSAEELDTAFKQNLCEWYGGQQKRKKLSLFLKKHPWLAVDRAPGMTTMFEIGYQRMKKPAKWKFAVNNSKGSAPPMRALPFAFVKSNDVDGIIDVTTKYTHGHPEAREAAKILVRIMKHGLEGNSIESAVKKFATGGSVTAIMLRAMRRAQLKGVVVGDIGKSYSGEGFTADSAVAAAVHSVIDGKGDFAETMLNALITGGDSDTIATIAGALYGIFYPVETKSHMESGMFNTLEVFDLYTKTDFLDEFLDSVGKMEFLK